MAAVTFFPVSHAHRDANIAFASNAGMGLG